jgi:DNA-binding transcriptional LysR family regulator
VVSGRGERRTPLDDMLLGVGRQRRIGIVVPSFIMAAPIIATSDLMAMLPTRCIPQGDGFAVFDPPLPMEGFPLHIAWHRRSDMDIAIKHVCSLIRELFV